MTNKTTTPTIDVATLEPIERNEAIDLGLVEYRRLIDGLRALGADDWAQQTDCELWDVRAMAGHLAGSMWSNATIRRTAREQIATAIRSKRRDEELVDAMTAIQVERMADKSTDELLASMEANAEPAAAGRRRLPALMAKPGAIAQTVNGEVEKWALSYLLGIILTRDTWLHRVADIPRAIGREPKVDDHDARIVADVVAEWARRHGRPFELTRTGPAGGHFRHGDGGPRLQLDAVEFCRILSGRADPDHPLLETQVPF